MWEGPLARAGRCFFLAPGSGPGGAEFAPGEEEHARRVLRLGDGDPVLGLDGAGLRLPCRVRAPRSKPLALEVCGPPSFEPPPGAPGASMPHLTVALALPREDRQGALMERLVQWGAAAILPLVCRNTGPQKRHRPERLERMAREALKQCRGAHLPRLGPPLTVEATLSGDPGSTRWLMLDPGARTSLADRLREHSQPPAPDAPWPAAFAFVVGPEGGFSPEEELVLAASGAERVALSPRILRIETAAEGALAAAHAALWKPFGGSGERIA